MKRTKKHPFPEISRIQMPLPPYNFSTPLLLKLNFQVFYTGLSILLMGWIMNTVHPWPPFMAALEIKTIKRSRVLWEFYFTQE